MSSAQAFYFMFTQSMSHSKNSWRREFLKLSLGGKRDRVESVIEYEDKTIYRPALASFILHDYLKRSTKLEYTQALLRYRADAAARKRVADAEKLARKLANQKLAGVRGLGPAPRPVATVPPLPVMPAPEQSANPFDDFTIVDTEYQGEHLLEVAAQRYQNWQPVGEPMVSYVHCTEWIWPAITKLTGITEEHVRRAPPEKEVLQAFLLLAGDSLLIAHNAGADRSQLQKARERQGATEPLPNRWFCTMALARAREAKGTKCGLGELVERFGFSRRGQHQALRDVHMCFQVLRHYHQQSPLHSLDPKAKAAAQKPLDFAV